MTLQKCPDDELEKIIASEKAPLLARIEQLEKELSDLRIEYASKA